MEEKGGKRVSVPGLLISIVATEMSLSFWISYHANTQSFGKWEHINWFSESHSHSICSKEKNRKEMNLDQITWQLISDIFKGQWTDKVKDLVHELNGKMVPVPSNWTNYLQPLDLTVKKTFKNFCCNKHNLATPKRLHMQKSKKPSEIKVDVRISLVKRLHANCIVKFCNYISSKLDLIINGWRKFGAIENLEREIKLGLFL